MKLNAMVQARKKVIERSNVKLRKNMKNEKT